MFPGTIKDFLVVGGLNQDFKKIGEFSARGPTEKGITKPGTLSIYGNIHPKIDVVAPGEEILSISVKNNEYVTATGTKMEMK